MLHTKGKVLPIAVTLFVIAMIIYLFVNVEQPLIVCDKKVNTDLGIVIVENLETTLDNNKIDSMVLVKSFILPDKYLINEEYLNNVEETLIRSYEYLGDKATIIRADDRVKVKVKIDDMETIILNNVQFFDVNGFQMKINPNTKSSDVLTLKIKDNYTEGEFMTRLKNNGYSCK